MHFTPEEKLHLMKLLFNGVKCIPLYYTKNNDGLEKSWAIVEIQGDLLSRSDNELFGQYVGDLHFSKEGAPILIIGHQLLYGKVVTLEKPLAVLHRDRNPSDADRPRTQYIVKALVKKKLLFKTRPKPIISNLPKPV